VGAKRLARFRDWVASDAHPRPDSFADFVRRFLAGYGGMNDTSLASSAR
jgi:hypothetical protein